MAAGERASPPRRQRHRYHRHGRACARLHPVLLPREPCRRRLSPRARLEIIAQLQEAMALRAVLLLLLVLTALISQHLSEAKATSSQLGRVRLGRRLAADRGRYLDHVGKASRHIREREGSNQLIQRARRSWLADYLGDVWSHLYQNIPRAVLYVFPVTLLILLLLCCLTVALD